MEPFDIVEFVGPSSPVIRWPGPSELGVVDRASEEEGTVHVLWEQTTHALAWPVEWVRRVDEPPLRSSVFFTEP